jgi:DNA polymerase III alpha subunit
MKLDKFSQSIFQSQDLFNIMYEKDLDVLNKIIVEEDSEISSFIKHSELVLQTTESISYSSNVFDFDRNLQNQWFMPDEYKDFDIEEFLVNQCPKENYTRLVDELNEFRKRDMIDLLRWLKYFVDTCRKNNIIWGVGRGSSVSSYVLYLIGIHKIDSIKYNLDWQEFLR